VGDTLHYRGTRRDVRRLMARAARMLTGREADPGGIARGIQLRIGTTALSLIQQAFLVKSRGGTGSDGIRWKPLQRATIAQRRTTAAERKELGIGGKRVRGLLTPAEDKEWRGIFASVVARLRAQGVGGAEAIAARIAWARLKAKGAKTKLDVLGGRTVDIGRDTGRLFRSLTPGVAERPGAAPEQVFRVEPGAVVVGSNVPYARGFHKERPLWPGNGLPDAWWDAIHASTLRGLQAAVWQLIQQEGRG
jgi:hypothetical protein